MKLINFVLFCFIANFLSFAILFAQKQVVEESPVMEKNSFQKTNNTNPNNLEKFFRMDNPKEAAKSLKEHMQKYDLHKYVFFTQEKKQKKLLKGDFENTNFLINLFNDYEFIPEPGINS